MLQLDASLAVTDVDTVGRHVLGSERTADRLYALRADFAENGPLPWPVGLTELWESVDAEGREPLRSADWPAVRAFVARWYGAALARLQGLVELTLAPALIDRGLVRFPGNPDLLLARGALVETRLALAQVDASLASILYTPDVRQQWQRHLSDAERDFDRAVETAGFAGEAAVRLARVRLLRGQRDRARDVLQKVLTGGAPVQIRYLALLFRAAAAEQSGDAQAAARDYQAAVEAIPDARTPMLALGRIADESHQPSEALKWVERALASEMRGADPWRQYIQGQAWQIDDRMASLRTLEPR